MTELEVDDAKTGEQLASEPLTSSSSSFSSLDGRLGLRISGNEVLVVERATGEVVSRLTGSWSDLWGAAFSPDGSEIRSHSGAGLLFWPTPKP